MSLADLSGVPRVRMLNPMQMRFVEEYVKDSTSATKAAVKAGYSETSASVIASDLLKDSRVLEMIQDANEEAVKRLGITKAKILKGFADIAFSNSSDLITVDEETGEPVVDITKLQQDTSGATEVSISSMVIGGKKSKAVNIKTIKVADRIAALEKLAKIMGFLTEKVEVSTKTSLVDLIEQSYLEQVKQPEYKMIESVPVEDPKAAPHV